MLRIVIINAKMFHVKHYERGMNLMGVYEKCIHKEACEYIKSSDGSGEKIVCVPNCKHYEEETPFSRSQENGMTDEEIIKALECCTYSLGVMCKKCPSKTTLQGLGCRNKLSIAALELINRQKAENERLEIEAERLLVRIRDLTNYQTEDAEMRKRARVRARTEGIKQFARYLIGKSNSKGIINVSNLPDYVSDFLSAYTGKVIQEMEGDEK